MVDCGIPLPCESIVSSGSDAFKITNTGAGSAVAASAATGDAVTAQSADGTGITASSANGEGIAGFSSTGNAIRALSSARHGVSATSIFSSGFTAPPAGVFGESNTGHGVIGSSAEGVGVLGRSDTSDGVVGISTTQVATVPDVSYAGVLGDAAVEARFRGYGVIGNCARGTGVFGTSSTGVGAWGFSDSNTGVWGTVNRGTGVLGTSGAGGTGVRGFTNDGTGVSGTSTGGFISAGLFGESQGGFLSAGVFGTSSVFRGIGVYGRGGEDGTAGFFDGDVQVFGALSKAGGGFRIDHPVEPANKYLSHSFVESPEMKNVYDGIAELDGNGQGCVDLPDWFDALNHQFRYQLTAIGQPGPDLHISQEITNNRFCIAGGKAGMKVSWQVTGIRRDSWARAHPVVVEQEKPEDEKGYYQNPELYDQVPENSTLWRGRSDLRRRLMEQRQEDAAPLDIDQVREQVHTVTEKIRKHRT